MHRTISSAQTKQHFLKVEMARSDKEARILVRNKI